MKKFILTLIFSVLISSNAFAIFGFGSRSNNHSYTQSNPGRTYEGSMSNYSNQNWFSRVVSNTWNAVKSFAVNTYQKIGDFIDRFRGIDTHKSFTMPDGSELVGRIKTNRDTGEITYVEPGTMRHIGEAPIQVGDTYYSNGTLKYEKNEWVRDTAKVVPDKKARVYDFIKANPDMDAGLKGELKADYESASTDIAFLELNKDVDINDMTTLSSVLRETYADTLSREDMVLYITVKDQVIAKAQVHQVSFDYASGGFGLKPIKDGAKEWKLFSDNGKIKKHFIDFTEPMKKKFADYFDRPKPQSLGSIGGIQVKQPGPNMQLDQVSQQLKHNQFTTFEFPIHEKVGSLEKGFTNNEFLSLVGAQYAGREDLNDRSVTLKTQFSKFADAGYTSDQIQADLCFETTDFTNVIEAYTGIGTGINFKANYRTGYTSKTGNDVKATYRSDPFKIGVSTRTLNKKDFKYGTTVAATYSKTLEVEHDKLYNNRKMYDNMSNSTKLLVGKDSRVFNVEITSSIQSNSEMSIDKSGNKVETTNCSFSTRISDSQSGAYSDVSIGWSDSEESENSKSKNQNVSVDNIYKQQQMMRTNHLVPPLILK